LHKHVGCVACFARKIIIAADGVARRQEKRGRHNGKLFVLQPTETGIGNLNAKYEQMTIDASITLENQHKPGGNGSAHRMNRQRRLHHHANACMHLYEVSPYRYHLMHSACNASDPASNHSHNDQRARRRRCAAVLRHAQCVAGKNCCSHPYTAFARQVTGPARVSAFSITLHAIKARR
jgi:hypothetical protein